MANPERDTYTSDSNRSVYTREGNGTAWFVGIIVVLALLAIGYLVFSANTGPSTSVDVNSAPITQTTPGEPATAPAPTTPTTQAPSDAMAPAPMTEAAPAPTPAPDAAPATPAPSAAPAPTDTAPAEPAPALQQ